MLLLPLLQDPISRPTPKDVDTCLLPATCYAQVKCSAALPAIQYFDSCAPTSESTCVASALPHPGALGPGPAGIPLNIVVSGFTKPFEDYNKVQVGQSFSFNDTVTATRDQHTIKAGVDLHFPNYNEANSLDSSASYTSQAAFAANHLSTFELTAPLPDKSLIKGAASRFCAGRVESEPGTHLEPRIALHILLTFHKKHDNEIPFDIASCAGYCAFGSELLS